MFVNSSHRHCPKTVMEGSPGMLHQDKHQSTLILETWSHRLERNEAIKLNFHELLVYISVPFYLDHCRLVLATFTTAYWDLVFENCVHGDSQIYIVCVAFVWWVSLEAE